MSKPIRCATCGDLTGVITRYKRPNKSYFPCPGKGNHKGATKLEFRTYFGLIYRRTNIYEETCTSSTWLEYRGINKFILKLLVILKGDIYDVNNKEWKFR